MITIKSKNEIEIMRNGCKILAEVLAEVGKNISPGKNTMELDKLAEELILMRGGKPAFKNYGGETGNPFPATICASVNDEIVHGIPTEKIILKEGDIFKVDIGMIYDGYCSDMARTYAVGKISSEAQKLIEVTEQCFWEGIKSLSAGGKLSDYSKAVQKYVEKNRFSVVRDLGGHGIGKKLHEDPYIPNFWNRSQKEEKLETGMTFALEPMVNIGRFETILGHDGWVFKTLDKKLSAHYENTVLITDGEPEVLTQ